MINLLYHVINDNYLYSRFILFVYIIRSRNCDVTHEVPVCFQFKYVNKTGDAHLRLVKTHIAQ